MALTTGATLEASASILVEELGCEVSIATLAWVEWDKLLAVELLTGQEMGCFSGHRGLIGDCGQEMNCFSGRERLIGECGQEKGLFYGRHMWRCYLLMRPLIQTLTAIPSFHSLGHLGTLISGKIYRTYTESCIYFARDRYFSHFPSRIRFSVLLPA